MRPLLGIIFSIVIGSAAAPALAQPYGGPATQVYLLEYKRQHLAAALRVDQTRVDRLLEVERRFNTRVRPLRQQLNRDMDRLRTLLASSRPDDAQIKAVLDSLYRTREQLHSLRRQQDAAQAALLTPTQQARYLMFQQELNRQLLDESRHLPAAEEVGDNGGGGPGPAAPSPAPLPPTR